LFEVILAIALSATLLGLIGTAINLYLTRVDASRSRVEEAQLARSILARIADDIRGAAVYQPQDTSAIAKLMASGTAFDVDSIDQARPSSTGSSGSTGASSGSASSSASSNLGGTSSSGGDGESEGTMPLGLSGTTSELFVDVIRLPREEELFSTITGYQNAQSPNTRGPGLPGTSTASAASAMRPTDVKSVCYFVRAGEATAPGSASATTLDPGGQQRAGGLVRQELSRTHRVFAEQSGNSGILDANQVVLAPEVVQIAFRYFDGNQVATDWDMEEQKKLPLAVEVRLWLTSGDVENTPTTSPISPGGENMAIANVREYRETVYLPMAAMTEAAADGSMTSSSETSSSTEQSSDTSAFGGSGSSFDQ
jgi:hypothetical protein